MPRKGHTPEQIIGKLREAEVGLSSDRTVPWALWSNRIIAGARSTAV